MWLLERRLPQFGWRQVTGLELSGDLGISGSMRMETRLEGLKDEELDEELARLRRAQTRRANRGALPPLLTTSEAPE